MAIPGTIQALIAAFAFGILVNASSAGFVLYIIGHGSAVFRDGLRLALMLFLASSAAWAQVAFLTTVIDTSATTTCQVTVIFSSFFDQIARVSIEQYLLWALAKNRKTGPLAIIPQLLLLARFALGLALVGETRVQFKPTCVPLSNSVPISITVIALDAVILTILAVQSFLTGAPKDSQSNSEGPTQSKAVLLTITGLAIWMGTSVTLLLGLNTIDLIFRTTVPAIGLFIVVVLVTVFSQTLAVPPERPFHSPQSPTPQSMSRDRDISTADSSEYPPSRYEDVKGMNAMTITPLPGQDMPRRDNNGLPKIARPITGVTGVGGLPLQGQLFPPMRSNPIEQTESVPGEVRTRIERPKKSIRNKGGSGGKITVGKLAISNPIIADSPDMLNSLNKIPTIDLATAAKNEKERRAVQAQRVSMLIANRPAPQPPRITPEEAMKRSMSTKRKDIAPTAPVERVPSTEQAPQMEIMRSNSTSQSGASLSVEGNASSTSAQLSPGNEDLRRRSPRQAVPVSVPAKTPTFQRVTPGQPIRIPIPRSQPQPEPPKSPEPLKTPLQRRPTTGLPSNPRAQAMNKLAQDAGKQRQQTIMFVNNIVYDDPNAVDSIIQGASKAPKSPLKSSNSIVHRGRPIPRKSDKDDRQVFPAEQSPGMGHRRSRSGGSISNRKSMLRSTPGSPTQLPPLPPPPKSAGNGGRPQPNDTKSMTFDEKMTMFFPAPPSASSTTTTYKRQSTIPDLPPLPKTFVDMQEPERVMESDVSHRLTKTSATDRSSIRTQSILGVDDLSNRYTQTSTQNVADELGNSWLPGIPSSNGRPYQQYNDGNKRKSSPIIPAARYSEMSGKSEAKTRDEEMTNWGSVHSPVAPVNVQGSRLNARTTYIKKESRVPSALSGYGDEVMTIMLDTNSDADTRRSFYLDDGETSTSGRAGSRNSGGWHRRIGDDLPTFSARKEKVRSRKMPPPTPLLLNSNTSNKRAIVVQQAEPSPVESPEAAYQMIQAQLRKFDEPTQESTDAEGSRAALLQNLELEMGQQESKWQLMQHNLDRDSMSSIQTDSRPASTIKTISRSSSSRSVIADRRASRRARMLSGTRSREEDAEADGARPSQWQTRLVEAQMEYMDKASDLLMKRNNLNFLSVSKADLGSPTPPDTDESDLENERAFQSLSAKVSKPIAKAPELWKPSPPKKDIMSRALWVAPISVFRSTESVELPGLSVRPAPRKSAEPLMIESSQLWQNSSSPPKSRSSQGLWSKTVPEPRRESQQPQKVRPVTQRPPRRNKRVTMLPDIVENPEPLPDKRGTLGIFQFPWGERSDLATVRARPSHMLVPMPGTMSSGAPRFNAALEARSRQLEADEYSSSFFDDYDEEEGDNFNESDDSDGDDFDENTLWEIASLLKTEQVPSKNSLLPPPLSSSFIEEYVTEDAEEDHPAALSLVQEEPVAVMSSTLPVRESLWMAGASVESARHSYGLPQPEQAVWKSYIPSNEDEVRSQARIEEMAPIQSRELWMAGTQRAASPPSLWIASAPIKGSLQRFGLPQPKPAVWQSYIPDDTESLRTQTRIEEITPIESGELWTASAKLTETVDAPLWATTKPTVPVALGQTHRNAQVLLGSTSMWEMPVSHPESQVDGLFEVNSGRKTFRTTSAESAALDMILTPRKVDSSMAKLQSTRFWSANTGKKAEVNWIKTSSSGSTKSSPSLFTVDPARKVYRTTDAEPAALNMATKPRKSTDAPLPELQSFQLWSVYRRATVEHDWISISSTRPQSPSVASVASTNSSSLSSPVTDVASIKTNTTKASSVAESTSSGWSGTKPAAPEVPLVPEIPVDFVMKDLDSVSHEKSAPIPLRQQYRPTIAYRGDWEAALSEAIAAGRPGIRFAVVHATEPQWDNALQAAVKESHIAPKIERRTASPKEWSSALYQALAASYPQNRLSRGQVLQDHWEAELREAIARSKRNTFDASKRHPVFAAASLVTKSTVIHPAAIGYTYDVATRHPVFFGSMAITCNDVHPAMSKSEGEGAMPAAATPKPSQQGFASQPLLWSQLMHSTSAKAQNSMWSSPVAPLAQVEAPRLPELDSQSFRHQSRVSTSDEVALDTGFGEDGMWKRGGGVKRVDSRSNDRDWLDDTMKKRFSRIELRY